jgi:hypothetical protein
MHAGSDRTRNMGRTHEEKVEREALEEDSWKINSQHLISKDQLLISHDELKSLLKTVLPTFMALASRPLQTSLKIIHTSLPNKPIKQSKCMQ